MCFESHGKRIRICKAKEDIKVNKIFKLYKHTLFGWMRSDYIYETSNQPQVKLPPTWYTYLFLWELHKGYHSLTEDTKISSHYSGVYTKEVGLRCIIPKGTRYAINEYNQIISEQLIITDEVIFGECEDLTAALANLKQ